MLPVTSRQEGKNMMTLQDKFRAVGSALKGQFLERDEVIDGMLCAALAGEHVLLVGAPGSAKSALVNAFTKAIDGANYFEWLLSKFSVPEELFGPLSLSKFAADQYCRQTAGKLPEAHIGFLDEVFKANSAILNTLLPIMNERKFFNDGKPTSIPLRMIVGASNELPESAELAALYDRFLVRFQVDYIGSTDNWVRMVMGTASSSQVTLSLVDWDQARAEVAAVKFGQGAAQELHKLRAKLQKDAQVMLSDRRWRQCVGLMKASAWLTGDVEVMEDHLSVLAPALWSDVGQIPVVQKICREVAGSLAAEASKVASTIGEAIKAVPDVPAGQMAPKEIQDQMVAVNREGGRALARLGELLNQAKTPRAQAVIKAAIADVETKLTPLRSRMREALGLG